MAFKTPPGLTEVEIGEEVEREQVKRTGRFLLLFKTAWWETVNEKHIGYDLHVATTKDIRAVYINGKPFPTNN